MPMLANTDELSNRVRPFSRKEAATMAGVSVDTIDEAIHQKRFPVIRPSGDAAPGRRVLIPVSSFLGWLRGERADR